MTSTTVAKHEGGLGVRDSDLVSPWRREDLKPCLIVLVPLFTFLYSGDGYHSIAQRFSMHCIWSTPPSCATTSRAGFNDVLMYVAWHGYAVRLVPNLAYSTYYSKVRSEYASCSGCWSRICFLLFLAFLCLVVNIVGGLAT